MFSWRLLRDHGRPNHRTYYSKVAKAEILDPRTVRFDFTDSSDRELPLILGLMPVLPKHAIDVATFEKTTLAKPIGSGPYVVADGRCRQKRHLQARSELLGRASFPSIAACGISTKLRFDYYRDANAYFEAFKAGLYDVRSGNRSDPLADRL